jgi:hypothetical protein
MQPVLELERRFMRRLEAAAASLRNEFPNVHVRTKSHPVGGATDLHGHIVAISCLLTAREARAPDLARIEPDLVDLVIGVQHLTTEPELAELYVCWGHPSGHIELESLEKPIPLDEAAWQLADESVPALVDALRTAIQRGQPPDWSVPAFPC